MTNTYDQHQRQCKVSSATVQVLLNERRQLQGISDTPALDCQLILGHILKRPREWLMAHNDAEVTQGEVLKFQAHLARRVAGEPLAYITGEQQFWNHTFRVNSATLIPRPETELLVETVLNEQQHRQLTVLDLGTGSGAIAVSLASERQGWSVTGIDESFAAIEVARENGGDQPNNRFLVGDWCNAINDDAIDIIVSNPPYIRDADPHLQALTFEPRSALTAGTSGLDCFQRIAVSCRRCLHKGGWIYLEHGYDQAEDVHQILLQSGYSAIDHRHDLQGIKRVTLAQKL